MLIFGLSLLTVGLFLWALIWREPKKKHLHTMIAGDSIFPGELVYRGNDGRAYAYPQSSNWSRPIGRKSYSTMEDGKEVVHVRLGE